MAPVGDETSREGVAEIKREIIAKVLAERSSASANDVARHPLWKAAYGAPSGRMVRAVRASLNGSSGIVHNPEAEVGPARAIIFTAALLKRFPELEPRAAELLKVVIDSL
jgi:hypothetical protein